MTLGQCPTPAYGLYYPTFLCLTLLVEQDYGAPKGKPVDCLSLLSLGFLVVYLYQGLGQLRLDKNNIVMQVLCFLLLDFRCEC